MALASFLSKTALLTQPNSYLLSGRLLSCRFYAVGKEEYLVKVAVIGDPNVGKSTLVNEILGRKINAVSKKVHTTRHKTLAVLNAGNTQIVFADTPGFVGRKSRLNHSIEKSLIVDAYQSVSDVDIVVAVHDASHFYRKYELSEEIQKALKLVPEGTKRVLALNKVDLVSNKSELLEVTKKLVKQPETARPKKAKSLREMFDAHDLKTGAIVEGKFAEYSRSGTKSSQASTAVRVDAVFMLSALKSIGTESLKKYLIAKAKPSPWLYDRGFITDQSTEEMIIMCVKGKMLDQLYDETPYLIAPKVELLSEDEKGQLNMIVSLSCDNKRQASAIMGPSGSTIRTVALSAEQSLSEAFEKPVALKLIIKSERKRVNSCPKSERKRINS